MKKIFLVLIVALISCSTVMAQKNIKLGHINFTELMQIMPGRDSAQTILQNEATELENTLKSMSTELQTRYNDYMAKQESMSELIKQTKMRELQDMQDRAQEFQKNAQQQLQERESELLKPIIDRARKAIEEVAKENGYTYVFDSGVGTLLYSQESDDIMPLVKKKLGI